MTASALQTRGYEVLRGLIDPSDLHAHMEALYSQGKGFVDRFVPGARVFYKDEKFEALLAGLRPTIEAHAGCKLFKTYSYARRYDEGDVLKPHRDRPSCEITVSICLGPDQRAPWPLWVLDQAHEPQSIELHPGDGLLYKGIEVTHWRQKNAAGPCAQLFLHYVDQSGPHAIHRDNAYKPLWFSIPIFGRIFSIGFIPPYTCECGLIAHKAKRKKRKP